MKEETSYQERFGEKIKAIGYDLGVNSFIEQAIQEKILRYSLKNLVKFGDKRHGYCSLIDVRFDVFNRLTAIVEKLIQFDKYPDVTKNQIENTVREFLIDNAGGRGKIQLMYRKSIDERQVAKYLDVFIQISTKINQFKSYNVGLTDVMFNLKDLKEYFTTLNELRDKKVV